MRTLKDIFLDKKQLANRAHATVSADWWAEFMSFTKGHLLAERNVTAEHLQGMKMLEDAMQNMVIPDDDAPTPITSGLRHNLEDDINPSKRKGLQPKQAEAPKEKDK